MKSNVTKNDSVMQRIKQMSPKKLTGSLVLIALAAIVFFMVIFYANHNRPVYRSSDTSGSDYEVGKVVKVVKDNTTTDQSDKTLLRGSMELKIEILSGRYKGDVADVTNNFSTLYNIQVKEGDKVSIRIDTTQKDKYQVSIYNYYRVPAIIGCVIVFILFLVGIGGKKGAKSVIGLIFTMICIIYILIPLALKGFSVLGVTIGIILVCNFLCFFLIDGIRKKTVVAAMGSVFGVLTGALFAIFAQEIMHVTTYQMDEAETLNLITSTTSLHLNDLLLCGILIACMGAVMDVAMSIASATAELHDVNPGLGRNELFRSGMNIGKDAMGTMSNTLILAFAGNSFNMLLMIYSYGVGFQQLMNTDFIAVQVIQSIAGSIGIVCTVPIVAFISASVFGKKGSSRN